jgi:hypothetical protein
VNHLLVSLSISWYLGQKEGRREEGGRRKEDGGKWRMEGEERRKEGGRGGRKEGGGVPIKKKTQYLRQNIRFNSGFVKM